jgi:hypothetical protein
MQINVTLIRQYLVASREMWTYPHNNPHYRASKKYPDGLPYERRREHSPVKAQNDKLR